MKQLYHGDYNEYESIFGIPWYSAHRVDLHNELKRLVSELDIPIHLASETTHVDADQGVLVLKDGTHVQKDLIIAADGVHVSITKHFATYKILIKAAVSRHKHGKWQGNSCE